MRVLLVLCILSLITNAQNLQDFKQIDNNYNSYLKSIFGPSFTKETKQKYKVSNPTVSIQKDVVPWKEHTVTNKYQPLVKVFSGNTFTYKSPCLFFLKENDDSNGYYRISIIATSSNKNLTFIKYSLKDQDNNTWQSGEVCLQNLSGNWEGIDVTWDGKTKNRTDANGGNYSDPEQAQIRIDAIREGNQQNESFQKNEGLISVSFNDNDLSGTLSAGDMFSIKGNDDLHVANDSYFFEIYYDLTDESITWIQLG